MFFAGSDTTGNTVQIGGGAAKVTDGSREVFHGTYLFCFTKQRFLAAAGDGGALMAGDGTEGAVAGTATDCGQRVLDHSRSRDIGKGWVLTAGKGELVEAVHLLCGELGRLRVLNNP